MRDSITATGTFVLAITPDPGALTAFVEQVAPLVRERVGKRRAWSSTPLTEGR